MEKIINQLPKPAYRLDRMPPYGFAVIGKRITQMKAEGHDVIRLDIGNPDMPPPEHVIKVLKQSASDPTRHSYGSYSGDPKFRKAVAGYYQRHFGVSLDDTREVLPLIGSKEGLINMALAYLDRGDAAITPSLSYPAYQMGALMAGGDTIELHLDPDRGYRPDFDLLSRQDLSKAKLLWLNFPHNPTGAVVGLDVYQEAVDFCRTHHLLLCSDNPYAEVVFDGYVAPSVLQIPEAKDCAVEFMSLSKMFNMAGWRLGACVGNAEALANLLVIKSNIDSGHWQAIYDAGVAALNDTPASWHNARNARYQARRDQIISVLRGLGLEVFKSPASLYVWARVPDGDDMAFCEQTLTEALVAITPGQMYGEAGHGYVRFSLGVEESRLADALRRLQNWYDLKH